jgi:hypothetical protein
MSCVGLSGSVVPLAIDHAESKMTTLGPRHAELGSTTQHSTYLATIYTDHVLMVRKLIQAVTYRASRSRWPPSALISAPPWI